MTDPKNADGLLPMRVVARQTGLSPDAIRAWERRYAAVAPARTEGGTRRYSLAEVTRLGLLARLTARGHAIGAIARLPTRELDRLLADEDVSPGLEEADDPVDADLAELHREYVAAVAALDGRRAVRQLARTAALLSPRSFVFDVAMPILREVGRRWARGDLGVASEHLASAQLRSVLSSYLLLGPDDPGAARILVTTPSGQRHEFGALAAAILAVGRGLAAVYLGPDMPAEAIAQAVAIRRPSVVILGVATPVAGAQLDRLTADLEVVSAAAPTWLGRTPGHPITGRVPAVREFDALGEVDIALAALA